MYEMSLIHTWLTSPLAVYIIIFVTSLVRSPKLKDYEMDHDAEEEEEESLLATTGRRFGATWQDITGRGKKTQSSGEGPRLVDNEQEN